MTATNTRLASQIADLLASAKEARAAGDWESVRALIAAVNAMDPGNAEAATLLSGVATRQQMTLLFCDLVGSTALADQRDPEEVTEIIHRFRSTCARAVAEFGGHIDDHRGDGMLVLFGYPRVDEDDARRGVLCGMQMLERISQLTAPGISAGQLQARIAVHTDLVVVSDGITGSTANEASRIQQEADPGTLLISDSTQDLVWPWFETVSLGKRQLRGVSRPVEVFRVAAALQAPRGRTWRDRVSPYVNRVAELAKMDWLSLKPIENSPTSVLDEPETPPVAAQPDQDIQDLTRAVCVIGPSGMGKTRFTAESAQRLGLRLLTCPCSRMQRGVSLHAFRDLIAEACGIDYDDPAATRLAKLRKAVGASADFPFLATVFDIPLELLPAPPDVQPDQLRRQALQAAAKLIHEYGTSQPTLIFLDDVQWADQSSLDLIALLLAAPGLRLSIAARDGYQPSWSPDLVRTITLTPLNRDATEELVAKTPSASGLTPERAEELMTRSDGIPLYLEELLLTAQESDSGGTTRRSLKFGAYKIPPALRDPLLARLSRPEVDLELAQLASVIGRDLDRDLLQAASQLESGEFERRLRTLLDAGLLELRGPRLRFRHELTREVAYETQPHSILRSRHSAMADLLAARPGGSQRADIVTAALHLERAGRIDDAVAAHIQIAQTDQSLGTHEEAVTRLTKVLELLATTPAGTSRDLTELAVRELRSYSAVSARGYAAAETAEDYPRCLELTELSGTGQTVLPSLVRLSSYYTARGHFAKTESIENTIAGHVATSEVDYPPVKIQMGIVNFFRGDLAVATDQLIDSLDNGWTSDRPLPPEWTLPNDPRSALLAHLAVVLLIRGRQTDSEAIQAEGLARAESFSYPIGPFSVGYVNSMRALCRAVQGDYAGAAAIGQQLIAIGDKHGYATWSMAGQIQHLRSAVMQGDVNSLAPLTQCVEIWHQVVAIDSWTPYWFTDTGFAHLSVGDHTTAISYFDRALDIANQLGAQFYSSESFRGRALTRLALGSPTEATADLKAAVELASRQGATLFLERAKAALESIG